MKTLLQMLAVLLGLLIASALISPRRVHAQAAPGPMAPAASKDAPASIRPANPSWPVIEQNRAATSAEVFAPASF